MKTTEFIKAIESGKAQVLTAEAAKNLNGKRIAWMYFGYQSNDNEVKEMVVGDIVSEWDFNKTQPMEGYASRTAEWATWMTAKQQEEKHQKMLLLDENGENSYIFSFVNNPYFEEETFCCSDSDREVYYIVIEEENEIVSAQIIAQHSNDIRTRRESKEYSSAYWLRRKLHEMRYPYDAIWDGADWNYYGEHCRLILVCSGRDRIEGFMGEMKLETEISNIKK